MNVRVCAPGLWRAAPSPGLEREVSWHPGTEASAVGGADPSAAAVVIFVQESSIRHVAQHLVERVAAVVKLVGNKAQPGGDIKGVTLHRP